MAEHTAGPWKISGSHMRNLEGPDDLLIEHGNDQEFSPLVAQVHSDNGRLPTEANARLMAAAPELLEALKAVTRLGGNLPDDSLTDRTGPNDARARGPMYTTAREIAYTANQKAKEA